MCLSEAPFPTAEELSTIHRCPKHPAISLGHRRFSMFGYYYEHHCARCIASCIAGLPAFADKHPGWFPEPIDPWTIQAVLDTLFQKLGVEP